MTSEHAPDHASETYLGLDREEAERLAGTRGWSVVRSLPPGSIITMEYLEGRINFEVENGVVTRVWHG
ncbi:I78 family peptidase inhibitor [Streptomyces roseicoloratus]|uniref:I78 family peptidase inhibitor n=1 Tax=Streptomyces roseicoloratus TaxID=2508722 RepID=A0ABY9S418_9ACTN|nr:I78 family peptidase inhibitor [Streptomyces roseicoloratus]WMX47775.1 I78 family peptidase inhibitor [Streptomyces roseicoloratus]